MISEQSGVSIFFPCYNDKETIGKLVKNVISTVRKFTRKYEVIVVDDGSTDGSQNLLKKLTKKHTSLRLIFHEKNLGYGAALRSGFQAAKYEYVFYTDGDRQYNVGDLSLFLYMMTDDIDFINGIKMSRHDPTYRVVIGNLYSFLTRWLFWVPIFDIDCDFRLIRKKIIRKLKLNSSSGAICIELVKKSQRTGARFRQISIRHYEREFGKSQFFRISRISNTLGEVLALWWELMVKFKILKIFKKFRLQLGSHYQYNPIHAKES